MLDLSETFIFDSIVHAYNTDPSNYHNERYAQGIAEMIYGAGALAMPPGHKITAESWMRDWTVEEVTRMLFLESDTDMATFQPLPLYAFEDGLTSEAKAAKAAREWPSRYLTYADIDPVGEDAIEELDEQVEMLDPVGVKMYPSSWTEEDHTGWLMDDPEVAYPVFERALEHGIGNIDIHKAIPFGPTPGETYDPQDVGEAAASFPELDFSIVHGGAAFCEETAWLLTRYDNIYVNMEALPIILTSSERKFAEILASFVGTGGPGLYDKLFWSSAAMAAHPQAQLEAFRDFQYPDEVMREGGLFSAVEQITDEQKRKMLGKNYADFVGLDVEEARAEFVGDEFDQRREEEGLAAPYSETQSADAVV
jgi:predicted TIM-barrel fold metal-dependent hydrolase